jgi:hypothetical protein
MVGSVFSARLVSRCTYLAFPASRAPPHPPTPVSAAPHPTGPTPLPALAGLRLPDPSHIDPRSAGRWCGWSQHRSGTFPCMGYVASVRGAHSDTCRWDG